ncbi:MAG: photosystem I reaction center subunit PsaK [Symploca sp. SIO2E6]|nr:photosystem I reaction center subunit PsaK [Symploca sp. SIO2E6]
MIYSILATTPTTIAWSPTVGLVMILCNLFAIIVGRFAIKNAGTGPDLPAGGSKPDILKNFGIAELLATTSFGHILGAGFILGLANAGIL